ncbi:hypothetical protein BDR26DRAFT_867624 [Obelidium mucronatum]|nr:hypothetical protein BDR26DRAFT_867624 [Obelidium mucronatum]
MQYIGCFHGVISAGNCDGFASFKNLTPSTTPLTDLCHSSKAVSFAITAVDSFQQNKYNLTCCTGKPFENPVRFNDTICYNNCTSNGTCGPSLLDDESGQLAYYSVYSINQLAEAATIASTSSDNTTSTTPISSNPPLTFAAYCLVIIIWIFIVLSTLTLFAFIGIAIVQDGFTKRLRSSFNIQLLLIGLSVVGIFAGYLSLILSHSVVETVFSTFKYKVMKVFVAYAPIMLFLPQAIPSFLVQANVITRGRGKLFSGVLAGAAGGFTVTFDTLLLYAFITYIREMCDASASNVSAKLLIVASYGKVSCICGIISVLLFALSAPLPADLGNGVAIGSLAFLLAIYIVMIALKWALHRNQKLEKKEKESAIEKAKAVAGGKSGASASVKEHSVVVSGQVSAMSQS